MININGNLIEVICDLPGCGVKSSINAALDNVDVFQKRGWFLSKIGFEALCPECSRIAPQITEEAQDGI